MPLYEYECRNCHGRTVRLQKAGEDASGLACPLCESGTLKRIFSAFSVSRTEGPAKTGEADSPKSTPAPGPEFHRLMVTNNPENLK